MSNHTATCGLCGADVTEWFVTSAGVVLCEGCRTKYNPGKRTIEVRFKINESNALDVAGMIAAAALVLRTNVGGTKAWADAADAMDDVAIAIASALGLPQSAPLERAEAIGHFIGLLPRAS